MQSDSKGLSTTLDLSLVAALAAFCVLLVRGFATGGAFAATALVGLAFLVTALGIWRETVRESRLDEVEMAGNNFGARWGVCAVILLTLLSTFFAPLQNLIVAYASSYSGAPMPLSVEIRLFVLGLVCALLLQLITKSVITAIWHRMKR